MFIKERNNFKPFDHKVWLSSPTMHGPEMEYMKEIVAKLNQESSLLLQI